MSKIIPFDSANQLPAHLRALATQQAEDWVSGQVSGFPVLSLKGKVFHIVRGDEKELITRPDDEDEPATSLQLIILKTHKGVARTYYADQYEEGYAEKPDCYSNDGIAPAADAEDPQAKKCAVCPHSQWGSRITDNGKKGKACSEVKRLAVAEPGAEDDPMLLRLPPTSLKNWDTYLRNLIKKGANPSMVITKIGFDSSVSHQLLTFKPVGFVDEEMSEAVADMQDNEVVEAIIGHGPAIEPPTPEDEDEPEPEPRERKRASRKSEPEEEEEPSTRRRSRKSEPEEEEQPTRRRSRKSEPEEDEEPPTRRRRAPVQEEEEPSTRRRRRAPVQEEEEPESKRRSRKSEPEEDDLDLDLDDEDDKPTRRSRKPEPEEEDEPVSKKRAATKEVDADDDLESELDDMLGDLNFDDE